jgi:hypothetical protein
MSSIPNVSSPAGSSASSASSQQTIAMLQKQMMLYTQFADGSGPAAADYKALQYAIQTHNVSDAQSAMARLQRDSQAANPPSSATTNSNSPVDSDGDHDGSSGEARELSGGSLNQTA